MEESPSKAADPLARTNEEELASPKCVPPWLVAIVSSFALLFFIFGSVKYFDELKARDFLSLKDMELTRAKLEIAKHSEKSLPIIAKDEFSVTVQLGETVVYRELDLSITLTDLVPAASPGTWNARATGMCPGQVSFRFNDQGEGSETTCNERFRIRIEEVKNWAATFRIGPLTR